ncbi:Ergosterol biosynthetic protein 28 [Cyberlindnera fabianii]|nr:Ergosterol biosynthetic protein 28 [Cyberlindnera fabianii]
MSDILSLVGPYIPHTPGILPKWLLFISVVSVFNSAQTYLGGIELTQRVYEAKPQQVTPLSARTFGTWTLISAIIRFYGAYHLRVPQVYQITFASYCIALFHFGTEWLIYKTVKPGKGFAGPAIVATTTVIWMWTQWNYYVSA